MKTLSVKSIVTMILAVTSFVARADIDWRVSVKLITDAAGNPPPGAQANLTAAFNSANRLLNRSGRGYGFDVEFVTYTNLPTWHGASVTPGNKAILQDAIRESPSFYEYRNDAINIYVTHAVDFGVCAFPFNPDDDILLLSNDPDIATVLHECGHFFNLPDTFQGEDFRYNSGTDCRLPDPCNCAIKDLGDDGLVDTAPDNHCFTQTNGLTFAVYHNTFTNLTVEQQTRTLNTFFNIMSCRPIRDRLTDDQLDLMTSDSNTRRRNVATGTTWFVASNGSDSNSGKSGTSRFQTPARALSVAQASDVILLRSGNYNSPQRIGRPATLRASRGPVRLTR